MSDTTPGPQDLPSGTPALPLQDGEPFVTASLGDEASLPLPPYFDPETAWTAPDPSPVASSGPLPSPPQKARRHGWRYALVGLAAGALGAALTVGAYVLWIDGSTTASSTTFLLTGTGGEVDAAEVARAVLPSIVTVQIGSVVEDGFAVDGSGSGVVLSADGLLVTNDHVVSGAAAVRVVFAGGRTYSAEVVGEDATTDLAVLRIGAAGLTPIALGSSEQMQIGDSAIAVGSPLGLDGGPSVTVGVVSAFGRRLQTGTDEYLYGMIQTDAPITRGSSGGALVDAQGRLIGITAAIGISDVGAEGLGFAIPVELMSIVTEQLIADGQADHPFLGIEGNTYFRQEPDGSTSPAGVSVHDVIAETAAAEAGVLPGDVIVSVDGEPLATMDQLVVLLRFHRVGEVVQLEIDRGGTMQTIPVTLMERPEEV